MTGWIAAIAVIAFLILIHELGHFIAAKLMGVRVEEFAIGFPPRLFKIKYGQTQYSIGLLLFGGYVKMFGQNIDDEDSSIPDNYSAKTPWQRLFIVLAGPAINIALAIAIMPLAYKLGVSVPLYLTKGPAIIETVEQQSLAEKAGFLSGDMVASVNGVKTSNWQEVNEELSKTKDEVKIILTNPKDSTERTINLKASSLLTKNYGWQPLVPPIVGAVKADWPAAIAGLKEGDKIVSINGKSVNSFAEISEILKTEKSNPLQVVYERMNGNSAETVNAQIIARYDNASDNWRLGFAAGSTKVVYSLSDSLQKGWNNIVKLTGELFSFVGRLFTGQVSKNDVGGPIMIVKIIGEASDQGISPLLIMMAFISFQLGIFNLFPLPVLDGGHAIIIIGELITKKQPSMKIRTRIQQIGVLILLGLMLFITVQDILRL